MWLYELDRVDTLQYVYHMRNSISHMSSFGPHEILNACEMQNTTSHFTSNITYRESMFYVVKKKVHKSTSHLFIFQT